MQPKKIAQLIRELALDKKAESPVILDLSKLTSVAHYFVILHGNSDRHVRALGNYIVDSLKDKKIKVWHIEGMDTGQWVLLDFGDVIVHIFYGPVREFYSLERLWGDAARI